MSIARGGSVLTYVLSPLVARHLGVTCAFWLGAALCSASFAVNVWSVHMDKCEGEAARLADVTSNTQATWEDIVNMPRLYWLLTALGVVLYSGILPFNNIASAYFVETAFAAQPQAAAHQSAGTALSILFMVSALGTPPFGGMVDMIGCRTHFLLLSSALLTATFLCIARVPPVLTTFSLGCVYTAFAGALWPALALTVPQRLLGTAYGLTVSLQNAGLAVVPIVVAWLQSRGEGATRYQDVISLFIALGFAGIVLSVMLMHASATRGGILDMPSGEAEQCIANGEIQPLKKLPKGKSVCSEGAGRAAHHLEACRPSL